jgi:peptide/histidine transporter 3/4
MVADMSILTAGMLLVWFEDKVSWGFGYGICALFVLVIVSLASTTPMWHVPDPAA